MPDGRMDGQSLASPRLACPQLKGLAQQHFQHQFNNEIQECKWDGSNHQQTSFLQLMWTLNRLGQCVELLLGIMVGYVLLDDISDNL